VPVAPYAGAALTRSGTMNGEGREKSVPVGHVLKVYPRLSQSKGGTVHIRPMVAAFARAGHQVVLAAPSSTNHPWEVPAPLAAQFVQIRAFRYSARDWLQRTEALVKRAAAIFNNYAAAL
jgi:hypothetical protein